MIRKPVNDLVMDSVASLLIGELPAICTYFCLQVQNELFLIDDDNKALLPEPDGSFDPIRLRSGGHYKVMGANATSGQPSAPPAQPHYPQPALGVYSTPVPSSSGIVLMRIF